MQTISTKITDNKCSSSYLEPCLKKSYMEISQFVGLGTINDLIKARRDKFVVNFGISDNYLCRFLNSRPIC